MSRRYFGTDGVRGVVGADLTPELVERAARAATLWSGGGRVLVGRDTRASGPELEEAVARGIVSAGGTAVLGGVLPTPAVALLAEHLGVVVSASHNPPEYNGVKFFLRRRQARRRAGGGDRGAVRRIRPGRRLRRARRRRAGALRRARRRRASGPISPAFGSGSTARTARSPTSRPAVFERLRRRGARDRRRRRTARTSTTAAVRPTSAPCDGSSPTRVSTSASPSTATATGMLAVDERGEPVDGDQILACSRSIWASTSSPSRS